MPYAPGQSDRIDTTPPIVMCAIRHEPRSTVSSDDRDASPVDNGFSACGKYAFATASCTEPQSSKASRVALLVSDIAGAPLGHPTIGALQVSLCDTRHSSRLSQPGSRCRDCSGRLSGCHGSLSWLR